MVETRNGTQPTNYLHWGEEAATAVTTITTTLEEGTARGVISVGRGVMLDGLGTIGDVASVLYTLQEQSIDGLTTREVVTTIGSAGISAGATVLIGAALTAAAVPGWVAVGAILGGGYIIGKGAESVFDYMFDRGAQPVVPHLPIGHVSSARQPWEYGSIPAGSETNALDVRSDRDHQNGVQAIAPTPNRPRPSDTAIQTSRDIVAGKKIDPSTGQKVYADEIIRQVAAAQTKREQDIAAAQAAAQAAAKAQADAKIKQAQDAAKAKSDLNAKLAQESAEKAKADVKAKIEAANKQKEQNRDRQDPGGGGDGGNNIIPSGNKGSEGQSNFGGDPNKSSRAGGVTYGGSNTYNGYVVGDYRTGYGNPYVNTGNNPGNNNAPGYHGSPYGGSSSSSSTTRTSQAARNGHPIVLDLDGDGVEISPLGGSTARFDYDNDDFRELTAWVGADDGLLVYDIGGDRRVSQAKKVVLGEWAALSSFPTAVGSRRRAVCQGRQLGIIRVRNGSTVGVKYGYRWGGLPQCLPNAGKTLPALFPTRST